MLHLTCVRQCKYWGILRVTRGDRVLLLFWPLLLRWRFVNSCFAYKFVSIFKHRIRKQENLAQCLHSISSEFLKMLFCTNAVGRLLSVGFSSSHLESFIHGESYFLSFKDFFPLAYDVIWLSRFFVPLWNDQHSNKPRTQVTAHTFRVQWSSRETAVKLTCYKCVLCSNSVGHHMHRPIFIHLKLC